MPCDTIKNFQDNEIKEIPVGYDSETDKFGTVEKITYKTRNYAGDKEEYEKSAFVYLPYGYQQEDRNQKYDVVYLLHGGGDDESWYMDDDKYRDGIALLLDHMIANGEIAPCILCTPTYQNPYSGSEAVSVEFFPEEFRNDLIPAVEGKYHTYYDGKNASASRWHRVFSGFSMGAACTWWVFEKCMDEVALYMPVSGDSWCGGSNGREKVVHLEKALKKQGYDGEDFRLFYGCGDVGDIAYQNVEAQVDAMESHGKEFKFCGNYRDGNSYYEIVDGGGHQIDTVYSVFYSGLQCMMSEKKNAEEWDAWYRERMAEREPEEILEKKEDFYYGRIKKYYYYSTTAKRRTGVNVLLPDEYSKERKYPVLYLLHGYFDDEDWMADESVGLKRMLGNLTAMGEAKDMEVVMPYIFCSAEKKRCTGMDLENSLCYDNFVNDLIKDLMPFIEKRFSVAKGRENTAITGFSMGGRESLFIGVTHPELFGYVGAVCPAPGLTPMKGSAQHPGQLEEAELCFEAGREPGLLLLSAAEKDAAVGHTPEGIHRLFQKNHVRHIWNVIPDGGHDASSVRVHLYNYLRMIFWNKG